MSELVQDPKHINRAGLVHPSEYDKAIDQLEKAGFVTELWIEPKHQHIALRWIKNGAKWHVTARGLSDIVAQLDVLSINANRWFQAREHGTSNESNFAVRER